MTKKLLDNGMVEETIVKEIPRYVGICEYSQAECEFIAEDFKETNKVWTIKHNRESFDSLDTKEDWEPKGDSVCEDIELFQKYLDETYGKDKYEAYALGAYIHSAVSFAFNKGDDNRCRWDSGTVGFVGISKELNVDLNQYASQLSDAWNGCVHILEIWDNLNNEVVDEILSTESCKAIIEWKDEMEKQYSVTEYTEQF